jgi:hypothetical protein
LNQGYIIIMIMVLFLLATLLWWVFRLSRYKKKQQEIEQLSREIGQMNGEMRSVPAKKHGRPGIEPTLPRGDLLLILHKNGKRPWKTAFGNKIKSGASALIITSRSPKEIRSQYGVGCRIIWLNRSVAVKGGRGAVVVNPTNLSGILDETDQYFDGDGTEGVVLIDRFEEVIQANDINRVMRFLRAMKQRADESGLSVIAPLNYKAVPQRTRNQLTESFEAVVI